MDVSVVCWYTTATTKKILKTKQYKIKEPHLMAHHVVLSNVFDHIPSKPECAGYLGIKLMLMKSYEPKDARSVWPPNELLCLTGQKCTFSHLVLMESDKYINLSALLSQKSLCFLLEFHWKDMRLTRWLRCFGKVPLTLRTSRTMYNRLCTPKARLSTSIHNVCISLSVDFYGTQW